MPRRHPERSWDSLDHALRYQRPDQVSPPIGLVTGYNGAVAAVWMWSSLESSRREPGHPSLFRTKPRAHTTKRMKPPGLINGQPTVPDRETLHVRERSTRAVWTPEPRHVASLSPPGQVSEGNVPGDEDGRRKGVSVRDLFLIEQGGRQTGCGSADRSRCKKIASVGHVGLDRNQNRIRPPTQGRVMLERSPPTSSRVSYST